MLQIEYVWYYHIPWVMSYGDMRNTVNWHSLLRFLWHQNFGRFSYNFLTYNVKDLLARNGLLSKAKHKCDKYFSVTFDSNFHLKYSKAHLLDKSTQLIGFRFYGPFTKIQAKYYSRYKFEIWVLGEFITIWAQCYPQFIVGIVLFIHLVLSDILFSMVTDNI